MEDRRSNMDFITLHHVKASSPSPPPSHNLDAVIFTDDLSERDIIISDYRLGISNI